MIDTSYPDNVLAPFPPGSVELRHGLALHRRELTRSYVHSLKAENLLQNHNLEAGRIQINEKPGDIHWGWESPTSMVRGHYVGHWLSAASTFWATTGDPRAKGGVDHIVNEFALIQECNGGEWIAPIPEKYLQWIARGRAVWAPMYICHKQMMGLFDAYTLCGNELALEIIVNFARWFTRFTDKMSLEELDDLLDWETGGIQEAWADLYGVTGEQTHLELIHRFDRRRLIDRLIAGDDPLTNQHANQTVPEIMSAARAYEVTGDKRWRDAVEAYWQCAVTDRGAFATGGQTFGEFWTPPFEFAARLGKSNQEHCVVFNMSRLAERLLRWTGEPQYADYVERNLYNGIYAQQNKNTGMVAYYLPLDAGSRKEWATPTETFSCCMATMIQAGSRHGTMSFYDNSDGVTIAQYLTTTAHTTQNGTAVSIDVDTFETLPLPGKANFEHGFPPHRPNHVAVDITVKAAAATEFSLGLRLPWWMAGTPSLSIDGEQIDLRGDSPGTFVPIRRSWTNNRLRLELPTRLNCEPLPDRPGTVAFMEGPVVLAGLVDGGRTLRGDVADPSSMLEPVAELELGAWQTRYATIGQGAGATSFTLVPLHEVTDETYTVYFPVEP